MMENIVQDSDWSIPGVVRLLWKRRRLIGIVTGFTAVGAIVISLLLPKYYAGVSTVLLPEDEGSGMLTAALGDIAPTAAALIGGGASGSYQRFRAILSSRSVRTRLIDEFSLVQVYDLEDSDTPIDDALETLASQSEFSIDEEYNYLIVRVEDRDPRRSADMANAYVRILNERNAELQSSSAKAHREYLESVVAENDRALRSARDSLAVFQAQHGIVDLPSQTGAFFEALALSRAEVLKLEVAYEAALRQFGERNNQTMYAKAALDAARSSLSGFMQGREAMLPIAQGELPGVASAYAERYQEVVIQTELAKLVRPMYEQARSEETRSRVAVQVLDDAVPPNKKSRPRRSIIVILATMAAFFGAAVTVVLARWIRDMDLGSTR